MTVKELMQITSKSRDAIIGRIKKLFPKMVFEPRKKIELTDEQARSILESYHPGYDLSGDAIAKPDKSIEKTVRVIHEKTGVGAFTELLKELGKWLSKEEMHDFILRSPQIVSHEEPKQLKKPTD